MNSHIDSLTTISNGAMIIGEDSQELKASSHELSNLNVVKFAYV
jgi:hypothetical protein